MKVLYYIPMIHTLAELGSLKEVIVATHNRIFGEQKTEEHFREVEEYWQEVRQRMERAGFGQEETASCLHIFMDSLPDTTDEIVQKIIQDLAEPEQNMPVYQIIKELQNKGAKVYGTEDLQLLLREREYGTRIASGEKPNPGLAAEILEERDLAIGKRIDSVLLEGDIGLLFIGKVHQIVSQLTQKNFQIRYL